MGITPPRYPREEIGSASFGTLLPLADLSRRSKFPEESKAGSASRVEGAVIGISYQIYAPAFTHPSPPGHGYSLTLEIIKGDSGPDQLVRLYSKTGPKRQVLS